MSIAAAELRLPSFSNSLRTMNVDWNELEDCLFFLCIEEIRRFSQSHPDETFYGFAIDCNSEYGQVLLCLNTPEDLHQTAIQYSTSPPNKEAFDAIGRKMAERLGQTYEPPPLKSVEVNAQELRWSLGDWQYQGFNSAEFDAKWEPFQDAVSDACSDEEADEETYMTPTQDQFMRRACRVLVRLESTNAFSVLRQTNDFKTWVADHDELDSESWERLDAVRREMRGA